VIGANTERIHVAVWADSIAACVLSIPSSFIPSFLLLLAFLLSVCYRSLVGRPRNRSKDGDFVLVGPQLLEGDLYAAQRMRVRSPYEEGLVTQFDVMVGKQRRNRTKQQKETGPFVDRTLWPLYARLLLLLFCRSFSLITLSPRLVFVVVSRIPFSLLSPCFSLTTAASR
jgi:hypothetical protein